MKMNIHKFSLKTKATQPKTIHWHPLQGIKYPHCYVLYESVGVRKEC